MLKKTSSLQNSGLAPTTAAFTATRARFLALGLEKWFRENQRPLPWRKDRDPYRVWIAEVMLQQTTVKAVIPFFERFMERFPSLGALAAADLNAVYASWSGLGYYSRARNLLKAARELQLHGGFPQSYEKLMEFPGFGPYTARAVSSQAFSERVGVVDGNAIRVLSRLLGQPVEAWTDQGRRYLQQAADQLVHYADPSHLNQALMELGATVCTPVNPACMLCPARSVCAANANGLQLQLPLKKPRREMEQWLWTVWLPNRKRGSSFRFPLLENRYAPFLKNTLVFPGTARRLKKPPTHRHPSHTVTHHKIYIQVKEMPFATVKKLREDKRIHWATIETLPQVAPHRILQKALSEFLSKPKATKYYQER